MLGSVTRAAWQLDAGERETIGHARPKIGVHENGSSRPGLTENVWKTTRRSDHPARIFRVPWLNPLSRFCALMRVMPHGMHEGSPHMLQPLWIQRG